MNDISLESFIHQCDEMYITEEGMTFIDMNKEPSPKVVSLLIKYGFQESYLKGRARKNILFADGKEPSKLSEKEICSIGNELWDKDGSVLGLDNYDDTWKKKYTSLKLFPVYAIGNGDYICISLKNKKMYYASHDTSDFITPLNKGKDTTYQEWIGNNNAAGNESNMFIAEEGASIEAWKVYISSDYRDMKKSYRESAKLAKANKFEEATEALDECIGKINDLKQRVDHIPDDGTFASIMSYLNPLLMFIKNSEFSGITPGVAVSSSGNVGMTLNLNYTSYGDGMSQTTRNAMKQDVQKALNLFLVRCGRIQKALRNKKIMIEKKNASES